MTRNATKVSSAALQRAIELGRISEKQRTILDASARGVTLRQLAAELGVTKGRVDQIVDQATRRVERVREAMERHDPDAHPLDWPLELTSLSTRTRNCLRRAGVDSLREASRLGDTELLRLKNFGRTCLGELRALVDAWSGTAAARPGDDKETRARDTL